MFHLLTNIIRASYHSCFKDYVPLDLFGMERLEIIMNNSTYLKNGPAIG